MKLFRGYKTTPKFFVPKIAEEYEKLKFLKDQIWAKHPQKPMDALREMRDERFNRFYELAQIAGPQFFTDDEKAARDFAGEKGFVVVADIEDKIAHDYYQREQVMAAGSGLVSNFVISGKDLADHVGDWRVNVISLGKESTEGKIVSEGESTKI